MYLLCLCVLILCIFRCIVLSFSLVMVSKFNVVFGNLLKWLINLILSLVNLFLFVMLVICLYMDNCVLILGMYFFGSKVGRCILILVCLCSKLFSVGFLFDFRVLIVCLSIFIYRVKLIDWIWLFCFLFNNLLVLWIFRLCVVRVKLVFKFFKEVIVFRCLIVFLVIVLGGGVNR